MPVAEADEVIDIDLDALSIREPDDVRRRRIHDDPFLNDRLKLLLLDETPLTSKDLAALYNREVPTIWKWRKPSKVDRRPHPHPRMLPVDPEPVGEVGGRAVPGLSAGRAREWGLQNGVLQWRPAEGKLVLAPAVARGGPHRRPRGGVTRN